MPEKTSKRGYPSQLVISNKVYLAILEVLRLNEPRIYEKLPYSKTLLTRDFGRNLSRKSTQTIVDAAVQQILLGTTVDGREHVKSVLQEIFPAITERYDGKGGITQSLGTWLSEARTCHPELFDKYFTLVVKENELSQVELDLLVENASDRKVFILQCEALKARNLLSVALKRLEAVKASVPMASIPSLCKALFDIADNLPEEPVGWDRIRSFDACWQIVYTSLQREKKSSVRFEILRDTILDSEGLALPVDIVRWQNRKGGSQSHPREYLVEEKDFVPLSQICLRKIRTAISNGKLRHNVRVREISWALEEWAPKELLKWYRKLCRNSTTIPFFLTMMLSSSASSRDVRYYISLKYLAQYADVASLERKLASFSEDAFSGIEKEALQAFRRAVRRKKAGKPESDGRNIFDEEDQS